MSTPGSNDTVVPDFTLAYAHGTVMVIAWMIFASTGIIFARYGRSLHIMKRVKFLGELIWFQIHRFALSTAAVATLLGFLLILVEGGGTWVDVNAGRIFAHSILGIIVVCCSLIQVWMAHFRCHPDTRYRFIFNWLHRSTGLLAFTLSIPTIFLITFVLKKYRTGLIIILSLWSGWIVIVVIIFEIIEFLARKALANHRKTYETNQSDSSQNFEIEENSNIQNFDTVKIIVFCTHIIIAISLAIALIVLIWMQK